MTGRSALVPAVGSCEIEIDPGQAHRSAAFGEFDLLAERAGRTGHELDVSEVSFPPVIADDFIFSQDRNVRGAAGVGPRISAGRVCEIGLHRRSRVAARHVTARVATAKPRPTAPTKIRTAKPRPIARTRLDHFVCCQADYDGARKR